LNLTLVHTAVSTKLAELAGKAPLMMPQSVGPLHRRLDRVLVSWAFCKVRPFVVRDEFAREEARDVMSRTAGDIEVCPDIAFAGWPSSRYIEPAKTGKPSVRRIGIVPMDWTWARTVDRERALDAYIAKLAAVVRNLSHQGFELQLYGHSRIAEMDQDDITVAQRIADTAGADANVHVDLAESGDVTELREHFRSVSVVVGTRLHSCIVAMLAGTPAIGLAYQPKSLGTFRLLNLEEYCLDVESFEADRVAQLAADLAGQRGGHGDDVLIERVAEAHKRIQALYTPHLTSAVTTSVRRA
jgi:colanic acid/amylovoran biosynthesis protein